MLSINQSLTINPAENNRKKQSKPNETKPNSDLKHPCN